LRKALQLPAFSDTDHFWYALDKACYNRVAKVASVASVSSSSSIVIAVSAAYAAPPPALEHVQPAAAPDAIADLNTQLEAKDLICIEKLTLFAHLLIFV
jgi:hypothetical protein